MKCSSEAGVMKRPLFAPEAVWDSEPDDLRSSGFQIL